jgi:putative inorganic carbon (hco3(-)) transporter
VSEVLAGAGVLAAAAAAAAAILLPPGRPRSAAMLAALVLVPALILGDQWDSRQIADLRDDSGRLALLAAAALTISAALAVAFHRHPMLLPLAIVAALPFRIPLEAGGDTANLLVPLYLVIAGGVLSTAARYWLSDGGDSPGGGVDVGGLRTDAVRPPASPPAAATGPAGQIPLVWLPRALAAVVALYAIQTLYSADFSRGLQDVCFFFVPFSLAYALLREVYWDRRLLTLVLWVVAVEAVLFVLVGSVEYVTRSLFWNDHVIRSNEFHTYFRVNSVFWDPNIYGRYLALAITIAMAAVLWAKERRSLALLSGLVGVLWVGLVPTFSQSSYIAVLAGLATLAALRWSVRWTLAAVAVAAVGGLLVITLVGGESKVNFSRVNIDTSGRANLVSGGINLFARRPAHGFGSGSFPKAYREHVRTREVPVSVSHTEPITIAAEQGLVGLASYIALLAAALAMMWNTARRSDGPVAVAILAAFVALLAHTMAYAGFYEDPITWVLLAVGASVAAAPVRGPA